MQAKRREGIGRLGRGERGEEGIIARTNYKAFPHEKEKRKKQPRKRISVYQLGLILHARTCIDSYLYRGRDTQNFQMQQGCVPPRHRYFHGPQDQGARGFLSQQDSLYGQTIKPPLGCSPIVNLVVKLASEVERLSPSALSSGH